ncbi:MAG: hypothetical protein ACLFT0_04490 [Spirulinaceae cyanobacterium]
MNSGAIFAPFFGKISDRDGIYVFCVPMLRKSRMFCDSDRSKIEKQSLGS